LNVFKKDAELLLSVVPDAYIMLRLTIDPPTEWFIEHPDDLIRYNDGKSHPCVLSASGRHEELPGMYSICSDAFRNDAAKAIKVFLDDFENMPFKDRIIGFSLCAAGTCEWYYPEANLITDLENNLYGDFSPAFRTHYTRFLKKRYGNDIENLRRAWNDPTATFEDPKIPTLADRKFISNDIGILKAMMMAESADRQVGGVELNINPQGPGYAGTFLDANTHKHVADFFNAWHEGTADTIVELAKLVKTAYPDMLVGSYYGALGCCDYFQFGTAGGTLNILDSGYVDFLGSAGTYNNREPGQYIAQREMQDSFLIRNQVYFTELDNRVHLTLPQFRAGWGLYDYHDTVVTYKRDFARVLCEDMQSWYFDFATEFMGDGSSEWMAETGFYDLIKRFSEISNYAYSLDRTKHNEIALLYDTESLHYVSQLLDGLFCDIYRTSDLGRIGAPVDYYFHNDVSRPEMPDYKLYIMINTFHLSDAEREAIKTKARKNHASLLWLYAPGFIDPDAKELMSADNITATTDIRAGIVRDTVFPLFKLTAEGEKEMIYADPAGIYGYIDRDVHSGGWPGAIFPPPNYIPLPTPHSNPGFFIDDEDAVVLGKFGIGGKTAFAKKEMDGYTTYYCAAPFLRSEILQSVAEQAGVHLFVHNDDHIVANENFVMIHAKNTGKRKVYFKKPCSPFEVFEKKYYGKDVTEIEVEMRLGDTLLFCVNGEC